VAIEWKGIRVDVTIPLPGRDLEMRLETRSDALAIVGPSGAGKSTLLRVLAGVERRARGTVEVNGRTWQDATRGVLVPAWERRVGWVPQDVLLFPHLSVRENLGYAGARASEIQEIAGLLQVDGLLDRRPRRLSGGERQRVALGRALLSDPALFLLDEPFSALDRPLRAQVSATVKEAARARGIPLVLVSHDEEDAGALAGERWHLADGVLVRV
jgi:molybdate transport system ATP-binding protein